MNLLETLDTARNVLDTVISSLNPTGQQGSQQADEESTPIDFNAFSDIFSNILQENGVIGKKDDLNLNDSGELADNVNGSGNMLEDILVGFAGSMLFNRIDADKNKLLDLEEQSNFSDFINDIYNTETKNPLAETEDDNSELLTANLDIEA